MSALLDEVARRVGAPEGLTLHRTRAGRHQRSQGAWSWFATDAEGREVLAGYVPLRELVKLSELRTSHARYGPALEVDPA